MQTKLTLRLDDELIRKAKDYSRRSGRSLSRLVADYFALIEGDPQSQGTEITTRVRSLHGALANSRVDERDYLDYLQKKHR